MLLQQWQKVQILSRTWIGRWKIFGPHWPTWIASWTPSRCIFDIDGARQEIDELERLSAEPDFWNEPRAAGKQMRRLTLLKGRVEGWQKLRTETHHLSELLELALEAEDAEVQAEVVVETEVLARAVGELEFQTLLGGEFAENGAILAIHAGAGGTESQDWTAMLQRMYLRWAEDHGYPVQILDQSEGEEAGIKSVTLQIDDDYVYGRLRGERGVHRLVRLSPFDAAHRRHTSFALVEVLPQIEVEDESIEIIPEELRVDTYRSSGAGG
ncbi:MAG: PCRF domain-containing protein, partial [Candidatus Saccharimonadales bacterium]